MTFKAQVHIIVAALIEPDAHRQVVVFSRQPQTGQQITIGAGQFFQPQGLHRAHGQAQIFHSYDFETPAVRMACAAGGQRDDAARRIALRRSCNQRSQLQKHADPVLHALGNFGVWRAAAEVGCAARHIKRRRLRLAPLVGKALRLQPVIGQTASAGLGAGAHQEHADGLGQLVAGAVMAPQQLGASRVFKAFDLALGLELQLYGFRNFDRQRRAGRQKRAIGQRDLWRQGGGVFGFSSGSVRGRRGRFSRRLSDYRWCSLLSRIDRLCLLLRRNLFDWLSWRALWCRLRSSRHRRRCSLSLRKQRIRLRRWFGLGHRPGFSSRWRCLLGHGFRRGGHRRLRNRGRRLYFQRARLHHHR